MKDKRGFSLIELMAILIIIGLILIVVLPAVSRLITSNDEKYYKNYVKIIKEGANVYADSRKDDLGGYKDTGCVTVEIEELINENYIESYNDKDITCAGEVRLNNVKGNLKVAINLTCTSNIDGDVRFERTGFDTNSLCKPYYDVE